MNYNPGLPETEPGKLRQLFGECVPAAFSALSLFATWCCAVNLNKVAGDTTRGLAQRMLQSMVSTIAEFQNNFTGSKALPRMTP